MSKYEVISNWIKTCTYIDQWLYFNAILMENNSISISPISENVIDDYINGSKLKELIFATFCAFSTVLNKFSSKYCKSDIP